MLLALAGCAAPPPRITAGEGPGLAEVHLIARDWHTDIGLPVDALEPPLATLAAGWPGARYLVFGFGERAYLLSRNRSLADMLMALLPGPGAMLVTGLSVRPAEAFGAANVVVLTVSRAGLGRLQRFLWDSFEREAGGRVRRLADGPYPGSIFFASAATYSAAYTCNTWTADALAQAGLPVTATGVAFAGQVMEQGRRAASMAGAGGAMRLAPSPVE